MERDTLEGLLAEGLSLAQIGRRLGRHEATVGYWVTKHGLSAVNAERHAPRGALSRETLAELAAGGFSVAQIAERVGRSKATVRHWLGKFGLQTAATAGRRPRAGAREALEAGVARTWLVCPRHGEAIHVRESRGYLRCRLCRQEAVARRRRRVKEILVREAGGSCRLCGYDRSPAALQFHHLDPAAKEFGVSRMGAHRLERLRLEVRKCILLCSNCHAEVESGLVSLSNMQPRLGDLG